MSTRAKRLFSGKAIFLAIGGAVIASVSGANATDNYNRYGSSDYGYNTRSADIEFVRCSSKDRQRNRCGTYSKIKNARVYDKLSDASCQQGRDWGWEGKYIWVQNGCRAVFKVQVKNPRRSNYDDRYYDDYYGRDRDRYGDNYGYDNSNEYIRCSSKDLNRKTCKTYGEIRSVYVHDRRSDRPCREGRDWGYSGSRIWVQNGCRATFKVTYRYRNGGNYGGGYDDYGYDRGLSRDAAINNCIAKAERQLYRDGFRRARFDRVTNTRRTERGWRVNLTFRTRHGDHYHYPSFSCRSNRNQTRLINYDFGDEGRRCGFNYRLSS